MLHVVWLNLHPSVRAQAASDLVLVNRPLLGVHIAALSALLLLIVAALLADEVLAERNLRRGVISIVAELTRGSPFTLALEKILAYQFSPSISSFSFFSHFQ